MEESKKQKPNFIRGFRTKAIHIGNEPNPITGDIIPPLSFSSTFATDSGKGYTYSRLGNPTRENLEKCICALEHAKHSIVVPSGVSAGALITHLLKPGDNIVACQDMYGGLISYFNGLAIPITGYGVTFVDFYNKQEVLDAIKPNTRMIWMESPTNPLLNVYSIEEFVKLCKEKGLLLIFDNTFFSPYLLNPLDFGVDIVFHSGTKYIGGHSDIILGIICTNNDDLYNSLYKLTVDLGHAASPFDCFLAHRGLKTMAARIDRSQENAMKLAEYLSKQPDVSEVYYPGLPTHKGYEINKKQARGPGAMISFRLKGANKILSGIFCLSMHLFSFAGSLGGTEGLICIPTDFTHATAPAEFKKKIGVTDDLIRVSLGVEDYQDIEKDFENAFKKYALLKIKK